ncbi:efflux RND transporter periplasmic adaptor subunit [Candidatus Thiothrix sp. Deng01]|uniref:Efflux RND transporter periplasmic adaptor subunit n=1 Tax=Candidatus Thiothrix phosphatis TaxID=3112415 RepID=A0ABU6CZQ5_9GAMM|nr:efflux RND transporter periplasmic adaptor subunit [Candidatus Thiothrix sp. Deng01]MEB4592316.1 efflux RND transporter periplasmic adaptor subunit [Candidatus Thiothrix sp. Deng01]
MKPIACLPFCLLLALAACKEPATEADIIRPAQVWTVDNQQTAASVTYSGEIKARYEADLSFRVGGKLIARRVDLGDAVTAGQPLAQLDTADLSLSLASAKAAVAAAEADYGNAKAELARVAELRRKQFIGQSSLDAAQAAYDAAAARVASAKAQLKLSGNQAGYTELATDQPGVITAVYAEAGQVVAAGTPIVHIAYEGEREAQIHVGESTAQTLKSGTLVDIKPWSGPDTTFQGKVREVSPSADATRSFLVKISLLNPPQDLRLGVTADVILTSANNGETSWLPASALFQQGKQTAVWVLGANHQVSLKPISVSAYQEDGVTVSGLPAGTQVIAAGVHKLSAGQTINPVPYDGAGAERSRSEAGS